MNSKNLKQNLKKFKVKNNPNYIFMNGGKYFIPKKNEAQFLKTIYNIFAANDLNCPLIPVVNQDLTDLKNYRLFFDIDDNDDDMKIVINNIASVLKDCFIDVDTHSYHITHRKNNIKKYHLYYTNIFIPNEYQLLLNYLINKRFGKDYVDSLKSKQGLRVPLCRKFKKTGEKCWEGIFEDGSEYVLKDEKMTEALFINDLNIRIEGDLVKPNDCVNEHLKSKAFLEFTGRLNTERRNVNIINTGLKVNNEITEAIREKYDICGEYQKGNVIYYHINADCPYVKRRHKSNNTKIEYYIDTSMIYLTCCDEECAKNNPKINITHDIIQRECLIDDDTDDDDYFEVEKFQEIKNDDNEFKNDDNEFNEISKQLTALQEQKIELETQTDNLENIDTDTISKQEKKQNKLRIKMNKKELKKKDRKIKDIEKIKKMEQEALDKFKERELINKRISYFEKFHCKILAPFSYIEKRRNTINLYKHDPFKKRNCNLMEGKFIDSWFECPDIRTYDKIDFLPPPLEQQEHIYNSYTGIRIDKIKNYNEVDFSKITDHIKLLVGKDEETETGYNKKGYEYMLNYLSHMVQKIGELPRVALVFKGEEGTGKNIFWNLFGTKILGKEYVLETAEMEKIVGRFNMLNQKFIIILDETTGKDSFMNSDKLKNIITQDTIAWEQKGMQGITIRNCGRYIFLTNNDTPIKIGLTDRRFVVFEMSSEKRNNSEYFKGLVEAFNNDDVLMSFVNFLKERKIENWDSIHDRPITKTYKEIQSVNIPIYARFLIYWTEKYNVDKIYSGIDLYKKFRSFLEDHGYEIKISNSSFGRYIKKYKGVSVKRTKRGMEYKLKYQEIYQNLIDKKYMKKPECLVEI